MGRVRTEMVKKLARELLQADPHRFTTNYEENKKVVNELVTDKTKRVRNRIAGYVTRLKTIENQRLSGVVPSSPVMPEEIERE